MPPLLRTGAPVRLELMVALLERVDAVLLTVLGRWVELANGLLVGWLVVDGPRVLG